MDASPRGPAIVDHVPADAGIDLQQALYRLGNDRQLLRELAQIYIEDAPPLLEQAAAGSAHTDIEEAARSAHSLKGLASNFSAAAANAAQAAESAIRSGDRVRIDSSLATLQTFTERLIAELKRTVLQSPSEEI